MLKPEMLHNVPKLVVPVHLQPGDGTRYEFMVWRDVHEHDLIWVGKGVSGADWKLTYLSEETVLDQIKQMGPWRYDDDFVEGTFAYRLAGVEEVNPWTVVAAFMAIEHFLAIEKATTTIAEFLAKET